MSGAENPGRLFRVESSHRAATELLEDSAVPLVDPYWPVLKRKNHHLMNVTALA
jgi:hypothetical protein